MSTDSIPPDADPNDLQDGGDGTGFPPVNHRPPEIIQRPQSQQLLTPDIPWFCPSTIMEAPTSLDIHSETGRAALANLECEGSYSMDEIENVEFYCIHYAVINRSAVDEETGEIREFPWITFFDPDGKRFSTSSEVVLRRLSTLIKLWPITPWNPPLRLLFYRKTNPRTKRAYHQLEVIPRVEA